MKYAILNKNALGDHLTTSTNQPMKIQHCPALEVSALNPVDCRDLLPAYTTAIRTAFDRVRNPFDWKAPIDACISPESSPIVRSAISYFTATEPRFQPITDHFNTLHAYRVTSIGYRKGPAGEH